MPEKTRQGTDDQGREWRLKDIQKLIDLVVDRQLTEFEIERDGFRIRIRRGESQAVPLPSAQAVLPVALATGAAVLPAAATNPAVGTSASTEPEQPSEPSSSDSAEGLYIIKSPIVGTFYRSPSPNGEPFVKPGDEVRVGQVLCIIEAMKLMNEIESEVNGEIVRIYVESGQPVEYSQSLFAIKPSHKK
ncbi:MAG TPA: acetyl-CoA carboxylase biotin carboxyl carrier protein [Terriglobia bacterium]|nr:acetyl-CoA carboxylase biotin carboxyl carrier protein [Terriglobia bacterium]